MAKSFAIFCKFYVNHLTLVSSVMNVATERGPTPEKSSQDRRYRDSQSFLISKDLPSFPLTLASYLMWIYLALLGSDKYGFRRDA